MLSLPVIALLTDVQRLHTSAASLIASPAQPGPQAAAAAPAVPASATGSVAAEAAPPNGAASIADGSGSPKQPPPVQGWAAVPGVAKALGLAGEAPFKLNCS